MEKLTAEQVADLIEQQTEVVSLQEVLQVLAYLGGPKVIIDAMIAEMIGRNIFFIPGIGYAGPKVAPVEILKCVPEEERDTLAMQYQKHHSLYLHS